MSEKGTQKEECGGERLFKTIHVFISQEFKEHPPRRCWRSSGAQDGQLSPSQICLCAQNHTDPEKGRVLSQPAGGQGLDFASPVAGEGGRARCSDPSLPHSE